MFSYYKIRDSVPIAREKVRGRIIYFLEDIFDIDHDAIKNELLNDDKFLNSIDIIKFAKEPILFTNLKCEKSDEYMPMINNKYERTCLSIIGVAGSGKSKFASDLIKEYIKTYPTNEMFLFSNKAEGEDPVFNDIKKLDYYDLNNLTESININECHNSLFVIDDLLEGVIISEASEFMKLYEKETYAKKQKIVKLRQQQLNTLAMNTVSNILTLGRSRHISLFMIRHAFKNGGSNILKTEPTHLASFVNTNKAKLDEYLKDVESLSSKQIALIHSMTESRCRYQYIYLSRQGLKYVISNRNIISIDINQ